MGWQIPNSNLKNEQKIIENAAEIVKLKSHATDIVAHHSYAVNTSGSDSYVVTIPGITEYTEGMEVTFKATVANTTGATLDINNLGAKNIYKNQNTSLETGDILANQLVQATYTGGWFQLMSTPSTTVSTTAVQTLTNKTLTTPKISNGGSIVDGNNNEQIKFTQTTSAVNEFTVKNAATGNAPEIQASGNDTNIDINIVPKGNGVMKVTGKQVALQETIDTHSGKSASVAHGKVRKEYVLFQGTLTNGTANLTMPSSFTNLNDFDEVIIAGTMDTTSSSTWKHFSQIYTPKNSIDNFGFSETHEILFTTAATNVFWLKGNVNRVSNTVSISYNRRKLGTNTGEDGNFSAIGGVVGVKYD